MANDGGAAFPRPGSNYTSYRDNDQDECSADAQYGMTLRDYFAAQAITALGGHTAVASRGVPWLVEHAYMVADAMLAYRDKE